VTCPLCRQRKARRACPALGQDICPVCCGTKRLKEIACPADCRYLASAQAHPPAVIQRQREKDRAFLLWLLEGLSRPQVAVLSHLQRGLRRYRPTSIPGLLDADVSEAAAALAATLETAARGIVYEHQTPSLPAQRVMGVYRDVLAALDPQGRLPPGVVAGAVRHLERGSRDAASYFSGGETTFLDFFDRIVEGAGEAPPEGADAAKETPPDGPRIILP
jgi:hypothetical protein